MVIWGCAVYRVTRGETGDVRSLELRDENFYLIGDGTERRLEGKHELLKLIATLPEFHLVLGNGPTSIVSDAVAGTSIEIATEALTRC